MSWPTATLSDLATFVRGVTFKPDDVSSTGVPVLRTKNVQRQLDLRDLMRIPDHLVRRNDKFLQAGDSLISSANSWNLVGKCSWVPDLAEPMAIGGFLTALRPGPAVQARYLYHWFSSPAVQATVRSFSNQTTNIANLDLKRCGSLLVPLPPIEEQRRIADILDQADALGAKRRAALTLLDDLTRSVFVEMFGHEGYQAVTPRIEMNHGAGWEWVLLADVARLATGHTPDRKNPAYWNGEISWISLPEIRRLDGTTAFATELRVTDQGVANSSAVLLPPGTICFSRTASIGFVTKLGRPMATSQDFHNWIPGPRLDSDYLMNALRISRMHLLEASDGSTHKTIYQRVAEQFRVLLPPIELQRQFVERVRKIETAKFASQEQSSLADKLFIVLQQRAFAGQL